MNDLIQLNAEWIPYMKAYRVYDPEYPQQTVAYVADADTMHVECY